MSDITVTIISILIPLLGTTLGAGMVFFLKKEMSERLRGALLGFASGVMIAASVWSLLIPALEMVEDSSDRFFSGHAVPFDFRHIHPAPAH